MARPGKYYRLKYSENKSGRSSSKKGEEDQEPVIAILADPGEVRVAGSANSFISITPNGISISGGFPSRISIQGLSQSLTFGGMVKNLEFPLTLLPSTPVTPLPQQRFAPPMSPMMKPIIELSKFLTSLLS